MKKNGFKFFAVCILIITLLSCTVLLGCKSSGTTQNLQYNKKYLNAYKFNNQNGQLYYYYVFYKNGTGTYVGGNYSVNFVYFYDSNEETISAFYDSMNGNGIDIGSSWNMLFNVTNYGLIDPTDSSSNEDTCILEDYINLIPNYNNQYII